jgi:hypothetical protein
MPPSSSIITHASDEAGIERRLGAPMLGGRIYRGLLFRPSGARFRHRLRLRALPRWRDSRAMHSIQVCIGIAAMRNDSLLGVSRRRQTMSAATAAFHRSGRRVRATVAPPTSGNRAALPAGRAEVLCIERQRQCPRRPTAFINSQFIRAGSREYSKQEEVHEAT